MRHLRSVAAMAVVARLLLRGHLRGTQFFEAIAAAIAMIGLILRPAVARSRLHNGRSAASGNDGPFVVIEAEPGHAFQDGGNRFISGPFSIGVFQAQHEAAAVTSGVEPVVKRRACAAYV